MKIENPVIISLIDKHEICDRVDGEIVKWDI